MVGEMMKDVVFLKLLLESPAPRVVCSFPKLFGVAMQRVAAWVFTLCFLASAQATTPGQVEPLGAAYSATAPLVGGLSRLTLYRPANDPGARAFSVYINQSYHTSLLKGGYTQVCIKPGSVDIGLRRVEGEERVRNPIFTKVVTLQGGEEQLLQLSDMPDGQVRLQAMPVSQMKSELVNTKQQQHTISRAAIVLPCDSGTAPAATRTLATLNEPAKAQAPSSDLAQPIERELPPQVQMISLASDALFAFGKSGMGDMLQVGRSALDDVITRIKKDYIKVDVIKVLGHSDPIGNPAQKQTISSQRAQTVRDYISSYGLKSIKVFSEGRSDKEPAVTDCGVAKTAINILCNRPNRRVTIEISGVLR